MTKKKTITYLLLTCFIGSLLTYYTANFIFADVGNYTYGYNGYNYVATIPGVLIALYFIPLTMLIIRTYIRPQYRKRTILLYICILIFFSIIGIISSISAGILAYGSFVKHYPIPYYVIVCLVIHLFVLIFCTYKYISVKKNMKEDSERKKMSFGYVLYSVILPLVIFFAYDRFGALLFGVVYIQTRTLYMTWPVYLWLTAPLLLLLYIVLKGFNVFKSINDQIYYLCLYLIFTLTLGTVTYVTGTHNTLFISAISPAFGLDRLATYPYDFILHFIQTVSFGLYFLIRDIYIKITNK